jgi:surface polysaccharide O-acyltransferase-like enzyme
MLLIVSSHALTHSGLLKNLDPASRNFVLYWIARCFFRVSVPGFVMVSGYFMCEKQLHLKKVILLLYQVLFYSLVIYFLICTLGGQQFVPADFIRSLFPVAANQYWFVTSFVLLLCFTLVLNPAIAAVNRKQHLVIILVFGYIYCIAATLMRWNEDFSQVDEGYNAVYFALLYLIAAYIRKYPPEKRQLTVWKNALGYVITMLIMAVITIALKRLETGFEEPPELFDANAIWSKNSPFTVIGTVFFFRFFQGINIKNRRLSSFICRVSELVFGVYLIHDNNYIRPLLWKEWTHTAAYADRLMLWPYILSCVVCIFIVCIGIEFFRKHLSEALRIEKALGALCDKAENKISEWLDIRPDSDNRDVHYG